MIWNFKLQNISKIPNPFSGDQEVSFVKGGQEGLLNRQQQLNPFFLEEPKLL